MERLNIEGIENGYKVDATVWRGAQPADSAWVLLAAAGCKSVIDLNNEVALAGKQLALVEASGMAYFSEPWGGVLPPGQSRINRALGLIEASPAPVFAHCAHGSDRTGTLCACWRIYHDGFSLEAAIDEAFTGLGLQGMHEFWMAAAVAEYWHNRNVLK